MNRPISKRNLSKRNLLALAVVLAIALFAIYLETRPRLAPGQAPLIDIENIETLRTQFNHDTGRVRLILLVSPT
jgi:hypothetical protein